MPSRRAFHTRFCVAELAYAHKTIAAKSQDDCICWKCVKAFRRKSSLCNQENTQPSHTHHHQNISNNKHTASMNVTQWLPLSVRQSTILLAPLMRFYAKHIIANALATKNVLGVVPGYCKMANGTLQISKSQRKSCEYNSTSISQKTASSARPATENKHRCCQVMRIDLRYMPKYQMPLHKSLQALHLLDHSTRTYSDSLNVNVHVWLSDGIRLSIRNVITSKTM